MDGGSRVHDGGHACFCKLAAGRPTQGHSEARGVDVWWGAGVVQSNVRMMVDAEHSYFQPAINHAAVELQRRYNRQEPIIYNTYQCYLKDSHERCTAHHVPVSCVVP